MYIFIENNNTKKREKKERRIKRVEKDSTEPNHYTTAADYVTLGKSL